MKGAIRYYYGLIGFLALTCVSEKSMSDERHELDVEKSAIIALANSGSCVAGASCRFIPFGSKACGGPKGYLVYAASIDTIQLTTRVQAYNQAESAFNKKWSQISDCSVPPPPDSLACLNGKCVGYYNGAVRVN